MREILFRGKRVGNDEWVEGAYLHLNTGNDYICDDTVWIGTLQPCKNEVLPETVGQYTGLTDNNGNKIFEGDIVDVLYDIKYTGVAAKRIGLFKVVFYKGCFMKDKITKINDEKGLFHFIPSDVCTVIGNIHDNPELLEVQNEQG